MRIAVTGASGLIGSALVPALRSAGHEVRRLVRRPPERPGDVQWDPGAGRLDALGEIDAVVHLAGAGVGDHRWTRAYRDVLVRSRLEGTRTVAAAVGAVAGAGGRPVLLSASAIGFYGDTGDQVREESDGPGDGFLAELCQRWEQATAPAAEAGARVVLLRTGIVLSPAGGALAKQLPLFRAGLGAPLGSGRQWVSWISLADEVAAIAHLLTSTVTGPVNLVAPAPVTNRTFTTALGRALHRPTLPVAVPGFALRAALGDFAREGVLAGQRLRPAVLEADGFAFRHGELGTALTELLG